MTTEAVTIVEHLFKRQKNVRGMSGTTVEATAGVGPARRAEVGRLLPFASAEVGHFETFDTTAWIVDDRPAHSRIRFTKPKQSNRT
jgi:hypothetical protein